MAKDSYFRKHKAQIHGDVPGKKVHVPINLTDAQRAVFEEGKVLLIDKPLHWTSFDVVRKIRNAVHIKKVGHAGTLDPLATGLLIVCTGKFTKKINEFMAQVKEYTGTFTLGAETPTYDLESEPFNQKPVPALTQDDLEEIAIQFTGDIMQVPPIYSAIKKNGTSMYELARRGDDVELSPRPVNVSLFEITGIELPVVSFRIVCSTGTYIRSLAHDFGQALGSGAHLSALRRTRIGHFNVDEAKGVEAFVESLRTRV